MKEMLAFLRVWTSQVLAFGQALRELMQDLKGVGPWKILKSLGHGHSKRRPWRKTKCKTIFRCALKKFNTGSVSTVDAGHRVPSSSHPSERGSLSLFGTGDSFRESLWWVWVCPGCRSVFVAEGVGFFFVVD